MPEQALVDLVDLIAQGEPGELLRRIDALAESGQDMHGLLDSLLGHLRLIYLLQHAEVLPESEAAAPDRSAELQRQAQSLPASETLRTIDLLATALRDIRDGSDARLPLEVALITAARPAASAAPGALLARVEARVERLEHAANSARVPASKRFDLRVTRSFAVGRVGLTAYFDARNLFNFTNLVRVFSATGTAVNPTEHAIHWTSDSSLFADEARASRAYRTDGGIDLTFDGRVASGCAAWVKADLRPAVPNCVYLIRAEERFGDGDHVFSVSEQRRASDAFYQFERGLQSFTDDPRRLRVGMEVTF